jgi:SnoaL-like protein
MYSTSLTGESNSMTNEHEILQSAYRDFNARNIDAVISLMHPEVEWANGMEGGHVHGRDEVRAYWTRQFTTLNPHVEPVQIKPDEHGNWVVEVHQVVQDTQGNLLLDTTVYHTYRFRDRLIARMDISQTQVEAARNQ